MVRLVLFCAILVWRVLQCHGDLQTQLSNVLLGPTLVLPLNALGLANRLRIMSSMYAIASPLKMRLLVAWQSNEDCSVPFSDMYRSSSIAVVEVDPAWNNSYFERRLRNAVYSIGLVKGISVEEQYPRDFLAAEGWTSSGVIIAWTRGTHAHHSSQCGAYLSLKQQFYRELNISPAVAALVQSVDFSSSPIVGVHIRAYDERYDWAVVSPSLPADFLQQPSLPEGALYDLQAKRFDQAASLAAFVTILEDLNSIAPDIRFFLASNSVQAKRNMAAHFGEERIITLGELDGLGERGSSHSIVVAAAEMYLLGATSFVIHTRGSSFAREAAARTSIPVIDVSLEPIFSVDDVKSADRIEPVFFYSQHPSLPFCALPEFLRAQYTRTSRAVQQLPTVGEVVVMDGLRKVCYQEDDRVLCTVAYSVCPCDVLPSGSEHLLAGLRYPKLLCVVPVDQAHVPGEGCVSLLAETNGYSMGAV